jgi:hypothetical protein
VLPTSARKGDSEEGLTLNDLPKHVEQVLSGHAEGCIRLKNRVMLVSVVHGEEAENAKQGPSKKSTGRLAGCESIC